MEEKPIINYIYFGLLFSLLSFIHIYHLSLIQGASSFLYMSYAVGQCFLEITGLMIIYHYLSRYVKQSLNTLFIALTFLLFLAQLIDFPMIRILGMTIWYIFGFIFAESLENFIEMLYATNLPLLYWLLGGIAALFVPILGILLFRAGENWSKKKPLNLRPSGLGMSMVLGLVGLLSVDRSLDQDQKSCIKALPWKMTFFSSNHPTLNVGPLKAHLSEQEHLDQLGDFSLKPARKPNIFLFICESTRSDAVTAAIAPTLAKFKAKHQTSPYSLSASNGTHLSWFSMFHSVYPFYWGQRDPKTWQSGSLPLQILKKAGYQVHVYSASRLKYYQMDEKLFGKEHYLADHFQQFGLDPRHENHENDTACISALMHDVDQHREGHCFIVFLDSTHFGYSWPQKTTLKPSPAYVDYLKIACSNTAVEGVKNRYCNAVHFIDTLFEDVMRKLKQTRWGKEAVVIFTGDHGEEFFEEGQIFHASHLSPMQTQVPLYCKLGSKQLPSQPVSSHLDIFPTILHHVFGKEVFSHWFNGESLLKQRRQNFIISTRYNASRTPFEFLIHNGKQELTLRFKNPRDILKSKALEMISCRTAFGKPLELKLEQIKTEFEEPIKTLFNPHEEI